MLSRIIKTCFFWIFPLFFLPIITGGCQPAYPEISLIPPDDIDLVTVPTPQYHPDVPASFNTEKPLIRLALGPVFLQPQTQVYYRKWPAYLSENLKQPLDLVIRFTYAEVDQLIKQGLIDIALVGSQSYVELKKTGDVELLVIPQVKGQIKHRSYIIVPAESNIYHLEDLRDKKFIFTDPLSFSGRFYILYLLSQIEETPDNFFSDYIHSYGHDNSVIAVAEGWVEAAAVDSLTYDYLVEENPDLKENIRIIKSSPPVYNSPVVISTKVSPELRERLKDIFLTMHQNERGQQALAEIMVERFVSCEDGDYDNIREFLEYVEGDN